MLRNKEDVKNITKALVILATVAMTGCGSTTPQLTSENSSVKSDAVQSEKLTAEKSKSESKKNSESSSNESTTKDNSESSKKKNEDSKNEDKENTSDNKQSIENKAKGADSTQPESTSKQADPAQKAPASTVKQNKPSASSSSVAKSQTCKTIHHDAQYETILHPAETHTEQVEHPATGHYEDVPITKEVGYIVCGCGEMFTSAEEYGKHSDPLVLSGDYIHGSYYITSKTETVGYEKNWVQDTAAYTTTETIVDKEQWTENKLVKGAYDESVCQ